MPVDKHGSDQIFTPPLTPLVGSNVKYLNFVITQSVVNIFTENSHANRDTIIMKHIKRDFSLKDWV